MSVHSLINSFVEMFRSCEDRRKGYTVSQCRYVLTSCFNNDQFRMALTVLKPSEDLDAFRKSLYRHSHHIMDEKPDAFGNAITGLIMAMASLNQRLSEQALRLLRRAVLLAIGEDSALFDETPCNNFSSALALFALESYEELARVMASVEERYQKPGVAYPGLTALAEFLQLCKSLYADVNRQQALCGADEESRLALQHMKYRLLLIQARLNAREKQSSQNTRIFAGVDLSGNIFESLPADVALPILLHACRQACSDGRALMALRFAQRLWAAVSLQPSLHNRSLVLELLIPLQVRVGVLPCPSLVKKNMVPNIASAYHQMVRAVAIGNCKALRALIDSVFVAGLVGIPTWAALTWMEHTLWTRLLSRCSSASLKKGEVRRATWSAAVGLSLGMDEGGERDAVATGVAAGLIERRYVQGLVELESGTVLLHSVLPPPWLKITDPDLTTPTADNSEVSPSSPASD